MNGEILKKAPGKRLRLSRGVYWVEFENGNAFSSRDYAKALAEYESGFGGRFQGDWEAYSLHQELDRSNAAHAAEKAARKAARKARRGSSQSSKARKPRKARRVTSSNYCRVCQGPHKRHAKRKGRRKR